MKSEVEKSAILRRINTLLLWLGPITSLAISPFSNFDPINLIKLIFVTSFAMAVLALMMNVGFKWIFDVNKYLLLFSGFFVLWMIVVVLVSDSPLSQQIWGVFGRNTGGLTYVALLVVLVATAISANLSFYHKLLDVLILTSVPMTLYALVQLVGRDPISWSEMAPFATLGNINFSSAFFGLTALSCLIMVSDKMSPTWVRGALAILAVVQMLIVLETGSIQGFMIFVAGIGVALFLWLRAQPRLKGFLIPYFFVGLVGIAGVVAALFNTGPLARFVFQNTILFRFDYWYAGWMMTLKNPIFGVGLDSYGDWYRQFRGEVATLRTGPDRITNTAHNIYLDISASGGFPLLLFYLAVLAVALLASIKTIRRQTSFNPYFTALFAAWIAYLIQAGVSINQVGVGIWGWLFTGALIGYERSTRVEKEHTQDTRRKSLAVTKYSGQLPASAALQSILGFGIGFVFAFVPFKADADFKSSLQTGSLEERFSASKALGATAFHLELVLDAAIKANDETLTSQVMLDLLSRYPRDFMAWRVRQALASSTPEEREFAYQRLKEMDPYNPDIQRIE